MNKARTYAAEVLDLSFFGTPVPWSFRSNAWLLSLHSGPAIDADGKIRNLIAYPEYESQRIPRNTTHWRRNGATVLNVNDLIFPFNHTGAHATATHWAMTPEGETRPRYAGQIEPPLQIAPGQRPVIKAGALQIQER